MKRLMFVALACFACGTALAKPEYHVAVLAPRFGKKTNAEAAKGKKEHAASSKKKKVKRAKPIPENVVVELFKKVKSEIGHAVETVTPKGSVELTESQTSGRVGGDSLFLHVSEGGEKIAIQMEGGAHTAYLFDCQVNVEGGGKFLIVGEHGGQSYDFEEPVDQAEDPETPSRLVIVPQLGNGIVYLQGIVGRSWTFESCNVTVF